MSIGQDLLSAPMGDMILQMALSIAEAQFELDKSSIMVAEMMGGQRLLRDEEGRLIDYDGSLMTSKRDETGNPIYDERGNLVYEDGQGPRVIDSRVFFGYTYERRTNEQGEALYWGDGTPQMVRKPKLVSMMELGFTPTFYQFVDNIIEVKIAIKMTRETESTNTKSQSNQVKTTEDLVKTVKTSSHSSFSYRNARWGKASFTAASGGQRTNYKQVKTGQRSQVAVQNVDASYSSKYSYSAEGASLLRSKLVPVPPPAILEERIRQVMEAEAEYQSLASAGLMGTYEKVGEDGGELRGPTGTPGKVDRVIGDEHLLQVGSTQAFVPQPDTVAATGTYTSQTTKAFTFVLPPSLDSATFTLVADADAITVSHKSATETVAPGQTRIVTLSGGQLQPLGTP